MRFHASSRYVIHPSSAWEIYSDHKSHELESTNASGSFKEKLRTFSSFERSKRSTTVPQDQIPEIKEKQKSKPLANRFKETFSRDIHIHFVGVLYVIAFSASTASYRSLFQGYSFFCWTYQRQDSSWNRWSQPHMFFPSRTCPWRTACQISPRIRTRRSLSTRWEPIQMKDSGYENQSNEQGTMRSWILKIMLYHQVNALKKFGLQVPILTCMYVFLCIFDSRV